MLKYVPETNLDWMEANNVLMFGWEFPPHISGGLGTACFGLTKALSAGMSILFVVPKAYGDEEVSNTKIISASNVTLSSPASSVRVSVQGKKRETGSIVKIQIPSGIVPYTSAVTQTIEQWQYQWPESFEIKTPEGIRYSFSGSYGIQLLEEVERYADVARELASQHDFHIIHAHDWLTFPAGIAAKESSGKPLVMHVHSTEFDRAGNQADPRICAIEKEGLLKADRVIAVSQRTKDTIVRQYGITPQKIIVIHNGVIQKKESGTPSQLGFDKPLITFLGRVTQQKGPGYFIEAAHKVREKFPDVRFVMAGAGDLLPEMIERVARLRMSSHFHFTGFLTPEEVDQVWSASNVYVMPSVSEPFGIAPLEAIQAGVPVIISRQSGIAEVMPDAIQVNFWDTDALADAICNVLAHKSLATTLQKQGKEKARKLTWDWAAEKVKLLYHELLTNA